MFWKKVVVPNAFLHKKLLPVCYISSPVPPINNVQSLIQHASDRLRIPHARLRMGIYENQSIHTKTFSRSDFNTATPASIIIECI